MFDHIHDKHTRLGAFALMLVALMVSVCFVSMADDSNAEETENTAFDLYTSGGATFNLETGIYVKIDGVSSKVRDWDTLVNYGIVSEDDEALNHLHFDGVTYFPVLAMLGISDAEHLDGVSNHPLLWVKSDGYYTYYSTVETTPGSYTVLDAEYSRVTSDTLSNSLHIPKGCVYNGVLYHPEDSTINASASGSYTYSYEDDTYIRANDKVCESYTYSYEDDTYTVVRNVYAGETYVFVAGTSSSVPIEAEGAVPIFIFDETLGQYTPTFNVIYYTVPSDATVGSTYTTEIAGYNAAYCVLEKPVTDITVSVDGISKTVAEGSTFADLKVAEPTKEHYTFDGWFAGETKVSAETVLTNGMTITSKFTQNTVTVTVEGKEYTVAEGSTFADLKVAEPTKEHANFDYFYYTDADNKEVKVSAETVLVNGMAIKEKFTDKNLWEQFVELFDNSDKVKGLNVGDTTIVSEDDTASTLAILCIIGIIALLGGLFFGRYVIAVVGLVIEIAVAIFIL